MSDEQLEQPVAHTSREKIAAFAVYQAEQAGGDMIGVASKALLPEVLRRLPDDPDLLDRQLVGYAQLCLELRSDGAPTLVIVDGDGKPVPPPGP